MPPRALACYMAVALGISACSRASDAETPGDPECSGEFDRFEAGMTKQAAPEPLIIELVTAEPAPPAVRADNSWRLRVSDADGDPAAGAELLVTPYMPKHQHGSAEVVVSELGDGEYQLEPIELIMPGVWEIPVSVTLADGGASATTFRFCIAER